MSEQSENHKEFETLIIPFIDSFLERKIFPEIELEKIFSRKSKLNIFDIGACEGEDSIRYSRVFKNAQIFTFEPLPSNQEIIINNLEKYSCSNVLLQKIALCEYDGSIEFHVSQGRPQDLWEGPQWNYGNKSSSILRPTSNERFGWLFFKNTITIPCHRLDSFCDQKNIQKIDFIHMDVQGAELLVLNGAKNILNNTIAVWLEVANEKKYEGQPLRVSVEKYMLDAGFLLIHYENRGADGDQFYVNKRYYKIWFYIIKKFIYNLFKIPMKIKILRVFHRLERFRKYCTRFL